MRLYGKYVSSAYLDTPPLAFAHRGGAKMSGNVGIENTVRSFQSAIDLGYRYIETDVQVSSDGISHVFHDHETSRLLNIEGYFRDLSSSEVARARVGGTEPVPTLAEALATFPDVSFNIDLKVPGVIEPTIATIRAAGAQERCLLASFSYKTLRRARQLAPEIATSMAPQEVAALKLGPLKAIRSLARRGGAIAAQVPARRGKVTVVDQKFVTRAHELDIHVHVWTVDEATEMHRLLDLQVDGIVTDRPDVLKSVLAEREQWGAR